MLMRRFKLLPLAIAILASVPAAFFVGRLDLPEWSAVAAFIVQIPAIYLMAVPLLAQSRPTVDEVCSKFAAEVRRTNKQTVEVWGLHTSVLQVSWEPARKCLRQDWNEIEQIARMWPTRRLHGSAPHAAKYDNLSGRNRLLDTVSKVPTNRLVVFGSAGAGKSILLVRLALDVLESDAFGEHVPVILPLSSWDIDHESMRQWLSRRLAIDYPRLAATARWERVSRGKNFVQLRRWKRVPYAEEVFDSGRLFLIIDGVDEVNNRRRRNALEKIEREMPTGHPLVLAVRSKTKETDRDDVSIELFGAAGIEIQSLSASTAESYLSSGTMPRTRSDQWKSVFRKLGEPNPVGRVLRTPLMVHMARTIYGTDGAPRPDEMCDIKKFPSPEALRSHLIRGYVPAAYRARSHDDSKRQWSPEEALTYLSSIARHLKDQKDGSVDFEWWSLPRSVPRYFVGGLVGFALGLVVFVGTVLYRDLGLGVGTGIAVAMTVGLLVDRARGNRANTSQSPARGIVQGIVGGVSGGLAGGIGANAIGLGAGPINGLIGGIGAGLGIGPFGGNFGSMAGGLAGGIAVGFMAGAVSGPVAGAVNGLAVAISTAFAIERSGRDLPTLATLRGSTDAIPLALAVGAAVGITVGYGTDFLGGLFAALGTGLVAYATFREGVPEGARFVSGPTDLLRRDRVNFISMSVGVGCTAGIACWVGVNLGVGISAGLTVGVVFGFLQSAWGSYFMSKLYIAVVRRTIPINLMQFLEDAYVRYGVLRQNGSTYQFRHEELLEYLSSRDE